MSKAYSLVVARRLFMTLASPVAERGLQGTQVSAVVARGFIGCSSRLENTGSIVAAQGLSCFVACGIFPD